MTRRMYDSVTLSNCPKDGDLYAGYVDGRYKNFDQIANLFPGKVAVPIAVFASTNAGIVLDIERGDATPAQAPGWVRMRRAQGVDPTCYVNFGNWQEVRNEFKKQQVTEPHYWVAGYNIPPDPTIPAGAVAHQYADPGPYDISTVVDYWPGIDPEVDMTFEEWAQGVKLPKNLDGSWYSLTELIDERLKGAVDNVNKHVGYVGPNGYDPNWVHP